jgi:hypothetical protein
VNVGINTDEAKLRVKVAGKEVETRGAKIMLAARRIKKIQWEDQLECGK